MEIQQLEKLANTAEKKIKAIYGQGKYYGIGKWIKDYGFFPQFLPLCILTDHSGPSMRDEVPATEKRRVYGVLKSSPRMAKLYREETGNEVYLMPSPFVYYRWKKGIKQIKDAKGTLVFPAHTTKHIEDISDLEQYIVDLKALPEKYQPITICLHPIDIHKGVHKKYYPHFPVVTAGHHFDARFTERFYDILKNYKYTTSNIIGSYTLYAAEAGIPFFLYGDKPQLVNKSDPNIEVGVLQIGQSKTLNYAYKLFKEKSDTVTKEQEDFVNFELGVNLPASRIKIAFILYKAFFQYQKTKIILLIKGYFGL